MPEYRSINIQTETDLLNFEEMPAAELDAWPCETLSAANAEDPVAALD